MEFSGALGEIVQIVNLGILSIKDELFHYLCYLISEISNFFFHFLQHRSIIKDLKYKYTTKQMFEITGTKPSG